MKDYRLVLKASLDVKGLDKQVQDLSNKYKLNLKINVDDKAINELTSKINKVTSSGKSRVKVIDSEMELKSLDEIQMRLKKLQSEGNTVQVTDIKNNAGEVTGQTLKYRDAQKSLVTETYKLKGATDAVNSGFAQTTKTVTGSTKSLSGWTDGITESIARSMRYVTSLGLIYGALNQLQKGIQYVKDLNKEMTNIQLVTGGSKESINEMAMSYNTLAKEMGATTLEVAKGSLEFIRQGKSAEDTAVLIRNSTMMSKLANMEASEATDRLTSIMNGFKLEASETGLVIDKLVGLDNKYATSVDEIATAMKYASNSSQQVGVDFDHLAAYITVISSTTRMSAETIGQAMKTLFARLTDIKQGFDIGEGVDVNINNVEKALRSANVPLRDSANNFRDMQDVLSDLGKVWDKLTEVEQNNIAKQVAGVRQKEQFLVLMEHQAEIEKALGVEMDSTGLAMERYKIYLEGAEAAQNKMTASWEKLAQSAISSGMVTKFYDAIASILTFVDKIGGIPAILTIISMGLIVVYGNVATLSAALGVLETVLFAIEAMNPLAWVAIGVGAILLLANSIETVTEKMERLRKEIDDSTNKIAELRNQAVTIKELSEEYKELIENTKRTEEETQRLFDVQNQLKDLMPELSGHFDMYGNFILDAKNDMDSLTQATLDQIDAEKKLRQSKIDENAGIQASSLLQTYKTTSGMLSPVKNKVNADATETMKLQAEIDWDSALSEAKSAFSEMSIEGKQSFLEELRKSSNGEEIIKSLLGDINPDDFYRDLYTPDPSVIQESGKAMAETVYASFSDTLKLLTDDSSAVDDLITKSMQGDLSLEDAAKMPEEYLNALTVQGDKLKINIDLLKEMQLQQALTSLEGIKDAEAHGAATAQQVQVVQFAYDQLLSQTQNTFGAFKQTAWQYDELLWTIANDAASAGYTFMDMQGNALNSAESIYGYLSSSDAAFNDFVMQAAQTLGISVNDVMSQIGGYVEQTYTYTADAVAKMAALVNSVGLPGSSMYNIGLANKAAPTGIGSLNLFPVSTGGFGGYGGNSGSSSSSNNNDNDNNNEEAEAAEKLRKIEEAIEKARQKAIKSLNKQLDIYKDMVDARKDLLDTMAEERKYQQETEESQNVIVSIQNEISELMLDNSAEAQARILALQEELDNAQQDLENLQYDRSVDLQKDALDAEYASFEEKVNKAIDSIENINSTTVADFATKLAAIMKTLGSPIIPAFHDGADSGFVGKQSKMKSNEVYAKLLKGEVVSTPSQMDNFIKTTLPEMVSNFSPNGGMNFDKMLELNVQGNLDASVLPDLETILNKAVQKMNDAMKNRGYTRNANQFSI